MPGPTVNWKKLDTGAWRSEIVEGGRYQLASPSAVTGNPSLAMQAGQSCTVRVYIGGTLYPDASLTVNGTAPVAILNAVGQPLTGQEKFDLVIEVAMPYGQNLLTTDEPNGSPSAPFANAAALPASGAYIGDTKYLVSPNVSCGMVRREWCNGVWQTPAGETILQKSNPLSLLNPGNTDVAVLPIATIPINSVVDGDWEMILGYEQGAANTGTDNFGLDANGVNLFSTGNVVAGAVPQLWSHHMRFVRMGTAIRIFYYQRLGGFVAAISGITIDFSVAVNLSWRAQPGNGANNLYLRNVALKRVN